MPGIGVDERLLSGEKLAQALQQDSSSGLCTVVGAAKRSDDAYSGEILFNQDPMGGSWTKVPVEMIESAEILGRVSVSGEVCQYVRLHLRTPAGPEAAVLSRMLGQRGFAAASGGGTTPLENGGTLPLLRAGDGVLPLRLVDGAALFPGIDPLAGTGWGNGLVPVGWRVGNVFLVMGWRVGN
ncbi:hypothetical protein [Tautonia plasticadhaerens]|uniref:Uncharacterized protein n=1 Tax=Tautonia plasticadhaerens TaxID=2527974 RepID=A0A518GZ37_9BACT|nr:hypothetical protein [Tautonia plasticadhaerens]QDV33876.1 hypothetical protein ElP_17560 [Tautonia plasticadhaerens]